MTVAAFDTHFSVKTLTGAGMPEAQAEAVTELLKAARDADFSTLATKLDLAEARAELKHDIAELRAELKGDIAGLRAEIQRDLAENKAEILKWLVGMIAGAVFINVTTMIGALVALSRIVAH